MILLYSKHSEDQHTPPVFSPSKGLSNRGFAGGIEAKMIVKLELLGMKSRVFRLLTNEMIQVRWWLLAFLHPRFSGSNFLVLFVRPRYWRGPRRLCGVLLGTKNVDQRECRTKGLTKITDSWQSTSNHPPDSYEMCEPISELLYLKTHQTTTWETL